MKYTITASSSTIDTTEPEALYILNVDGYHLRAISTSGAPIFDDPFPFCFSDDTIFMGLVGDCFTDSDDFNVAIAQGDFSDKMEEVNLFEIGSVGIRNYFVAALYSLGHEFSPEELEELYYYDEKMQEFLLRR